jgi:tetratricopeptide (TPR) repeat protein
VLHLLTGRSGSELPARGGYRAARERSAAEVGRLEADDDVRGAAYVDALVAFGRLLDDFGEYEGAAETFERAAAIADAHLGPEFGALPQALGARAHESLGRLPKAIKLTHAALREAPDRHDPHRVEIRAIAAGILASNAQIDLASRLASEAVAVALELPDGHERERAESFAYNAMGAIERIRGEYMDAEASFKKALASAESGFGAGSVEVAGTLNNLGMTFKFSGRFAEAEEMYERALAILATAFGEDHPDVAAVYHNLGGLAHARGDAAKAEPLAGKAVEIRARTMGPTNPSTALDRAAHAAILDALGRGDEAEAVLRDVVTTLVTHLGPRHLEVAVQLHNVAAIVQRRGRLAEAEGLYREALSIKEDALGPDSPALALTINNLGTVLRTQGRLDDAEVLYRRALGLLERSVAPDDPKLLAVRRNLGRLASDRDQLAASHGSLGARL